jgi:hypothetical protein
MKPIVNQLTRRSPILCIDVSNDDLHRLGLPSAAP